MNLRHDRLLRVGLRSARPDPDGQSRSTAVRPISTEAPAPSRPLSWSPNRLRFALDVRGARDPRGQPELLLGLAGRRRAPGRKSRRPDRRRGRTYRPRRRACATGAPRSPSDLVVSAISWLALAATAIGWGASRSARTARPDEESIDDANLDSRITRVKSGESHMCRSTTRSESCSCSLLGVAWLVPEYAGAKSGDVTICHVPPGNPRNAHTIVINPHPPLALTWRTVTIRANAGRGVCTPGATVRTCYGGPARNGGVGTCQEGSQTCTTPTGRPSGRVSARLLAGRRSVRRRASTTIAMRVAR